MKFRHLATAACVVIGSPFLAFAIGYTGRWVLTGKWVEGGGDRALFGLIVGVLCFGAAFLCSNTDM